MCLAHLSIEYDDGKQSTYECIAINVDGEVKEFDTGDPIIDWINYCFWRKDQDIVVMCSSCFDHWFMDGDDYFDLHFNKKYAPITKAEMFNMPNGEMMHLPHFIAKKPMKTVRDLEQYYFEKTGNEIQIGPDKKDEPVKPKEKQKNEKHQYYWD